MAHNVSSCVGSPAPASYISSSTCNGLGRSKGLPHFVAASSSGRSPRAARAVYKVTSKTQHQASGAQDAHQRPTSGVAYHEQRQPADVIVLAPGGWWLPVPVAPSGPQHVP